MYLRSSYRKFRSLFTRSACVLAASSVALAAYAGGVHAQAVEPPKPAPAAETVQLPAVEVTTSTDQKKKAAAKKKAKQAPGPSVAGVPAPSNSASADSSGGGQSKPGLNLEVPTQTGSRLGLTPLETPASVEVIPGVTIQERKQTSVSQAVTQNATGFTSSASPGNGDTGLAARGFNGHGSVMQLYDGTRLYVGAGTVTFPFDTWSAERIEVLRGPA